MVVMIKENYRLWIVVNSVIMSESLQKILKVRIGIRTSMSIDFKTEFYGLRFVFFN